IGDGAVEELSFSEFEELMEEGKVVRIANLPDYKLEIVTGESSFSGRIEGYFANDPLEVKTGEPHPFRVRVNLDVHGDSLTRLLGANLRTVPADETPAEGDSEDDTFAEFEQWVTNQEVELAGENALKLAAIPNTRDAYLIGTRQPKTRMTDKEFGEKKVKTRKFRVAVNLFKDSERLNSPLLA
ncbi:MAG: hypothetical protein GWO24_24695, partial [Akkermansiaceae bacterium]|nr:hypothetical protein [Akkermansiaceae bacterium]